MSWNAGEGAWYGSYIFIDTHVQRVGGDPQGTFDKTWSVTRRSKLNRIIRTASLQVPMSKFEANEFVDDRYAKMAERLEVCRKQLLHCYVGSHKGTDHTFSPLYSHSYILAGRQEALGPTIYPCREGEPH